jgi:hypothetical protein
MSGHVQGQTQVDKPQLAVGDHWTFKTIDLDKNDDTQSDEYRVTSISGDEVELTRTTLASPTANNVGKSAVATASAANWTFAKIVEGKYVAFAFPLDAGKTWEYEYKYAPDDGQPSGTWSAKAKAEGWEEVRVPAGMFKALKVVHEGRWSRPYAGYSISGTSIITLWYAPEVKGLVKREAYIRRSNGIVQVNTRTELVSLELTK